MFRNVNLQIRKFHRWGAIGFAVPLLVVILSGLLLQLKKQVDWVQPPTRTGIALDTTPRQSLSDVLRISRGIPEAGVQGWSDIDRLDVRPSKGIVKVRCKNRWEVQIDLESGTVLSSTYRRSDFIESLHDGSFFTEWVKMGVFLPNGIVLLALWITGMWLWYLPFYSARKKIRRTMKT